jgi:hypothetical protein
MKKPQFNCPEEESARVYHTTMRFWDACEQGNVSAMHREYESGADVNYRSVFYLASTMSYSPPPPDVHGGRWGGRVQYMREQGV